MKRNPALRLVGSGSHLQLRATGDWQSRPLEAIHEAHRASEALEKFLREAVGGARTRGCTWGEIGHALGTTRQSAWERFSGEE
jgi:hypothetical protein